MLSLADLAALECLMRLGVPSVQCLLMILDSPLNKAGKVKVRGSHAQGHGTSHVAPWACSSVHVQPLRATAWVAWLPCRTQP